MNLKSHIKSTLIYIGALATTLNVVSAQEKPREWAFENLEKYTAEALSESDPTKLADIERLRAHYNKQGHRTNKYEKGATSWQQSLELLTEEGIFSDMVAEQESLFPADGAKSSQTTREIEDYISEVWYRLGRMGDAVQKGKVSAEQIYTDRYLRSIIYYGELEIARSNYVSRFHESCFAIPTSAMNIYYAFMDRMEQAEAGEGTQLEADACQMLKVLALQAWTQPIRKDETDNDVSSVARFQHHVWWVGGNGLAFRSLLPVACMIRSIPMVDVLSIVAQNGLSKTSQNTFDTAFWSEGFTADGAGWGHGMQCLIWGYPINGTSAAISMLTSLQGTEWAKRLRDDNKEAIINFIRGSNWYYYKGFTLPCLDRHSFVYSDLEKGDKVKTVAMINTLLESWSDSFTEEELHEISQFCNEAEKMDIAMEGYPAGQYTGSRYFFNNDDLIKTNRDYHIIVNMASVRCDGIESATNFADEYNFTTCDGLTLFQRDGNEYKKVLGAWDVLRTPGVTARLGMDRLTPVTNWRGYCSMHNYAAAATNGSKNAVAGYIFEKMNASDKKDVNDTAGREVYNEVLYGIKAHKSYFMIGDYMLALGAGVTNSKPEIEGDIHTSIEQTASENRLFIYEGGKELDIAEGVQKFGGDEKSLQWLVQEGKFAYAPLPQYSPNAYYTSESRKNDWTKMNVVNKKRKGIASEVDVLQIWADHGAAPKDDSYGYVVYAGRDLPTSKLPFEVLRNDTKVQAAATTKRDVIEAVFYDATESLVVDKKFVIEVSAPAVLILEQSGKGEYQMAVTDPTMSASLEQITVKINDTPFIATMPTGDQCGKPSTSVIYYK